MKIRATRAELAETLTWVAQAIPKRPNVPVLAGVRLTAAEGLLTVTGFDYDVSHQARLQVDVVSEGECLVSGHFLRDLIAALRGNEVELVLDGAMLTITAGRSTYRTQTMNAADYPTLPALPAAVGTLPAEVLAEAVATCRAPIEDASATEGLRGLHLEGDEHGLVAVGMRSSVGIEFTADWTCVQTFECTAPIKVVEPAVRGLRGEVTLRHEGGVLGFSDTYRAVTIRTFSHVFAQWRKAIRPAEDDVLEAVVDVDDLIEITKRAGALSDDATPMILSVDAGEISVEVTGSEHGGRDYATAEATGEIRMGMAPKFLLEALGAMPPGPVRLGFGVYTESRMTAVIVRPANGERRVSMVQPRRVPGGVR